MDDVRSHWRWVSLAGALALLNASLSFRNLWPTPAVKWTGDLSVEAAFVMLSMVIASQWFGSPSRAVIRIVCAVWVVCVIGRYAEVTAPALYGREVNLYWDARHLSAVGAMLARVASWWQIALILCAAVAIPVVIYAGLRPALARIGRAVDDRAERQVVASFGTVMIVLFIGSRIGVPGMPPFTRPVVQTYSHQARLLTMALTAGPRTVAPPPALPSNLDRLGGADVFVIFIESYGAVTYDRNAFAGALTAARERLAADIGETGRHAVSAFVQSPTFGGNSWLAHVSLLSGVEVRDEDTNVLLMAQKRDTGVTPFARAGYRTVAVMPGLHSAWPEGAFYSFDDIYSEERLDYRGPPFGWWSVPDQFVIARMDALEIAKRPRRPVFVFYPTTNTHTPFIPTPPYQQDWARVLTADPYDQADLARSWDDQPDWLDLGPGFVQSLAYTFRAIGGYLRLRADRDFVMVLLGDHQPPAVVSGEGASWEVPVHVIASRTDILDALQKSGFVPGLEPRHPALMRMHELTPVLLKAFSDSPTQNIPTEGANTNTGRRGRTPK